MPLVAPHALDEVDAGRAFPGANGSGSDRGGLDKDSGKDRPTAEEAAQKPAGTAFFMYAGRDGGREANRPRSVVRYFEEEKVGQRLRVDTEDHGYQRQSGRCRWS